MLCMCCDEEMIHAAHVNLITGHIMYGCQSRKCLVIVLLMLQELPHEHLRQKRNREWPCEAPPLNPLVGAVAGHCALPPRDDSGAKLLSNLIAFPCRLFTFVTCRCSSWHDRSSNSRPTLLLDMPLICPSRYVTETWLKFQREIGLRPQYVLMRVTCYCLYREAGLRL